jgi:hypothetical protein
MKEAAFYVVFAGYNAEPQLYGREVWGEARIRKRL